ncbi:MAG: HTH-type transcriptional regulator CysB [Gammaproteobacteria bacterium]|jgi:LysR family cys regulon transcriptional activator|nr:HTH-type transcriptional regulator CysB [Gammaproteobacteria bacterium]
MKLQQLRYLAAIVDAGFNISAAAEKLHLSQPGVSRQLKLLEDELGFELFVRDGRALVKLTAAGQRVHERAQRVLRDTHAIKAMSLDARDSQRGTLSIATTHTQARYVLPPVIREFREKYPQVRVHLHQGTSEQIAEMLASGHVDIAVATGSREQFADCVLLPCYEWHRRVVVPRAHPLAKAKTLTLAKLAAYPLVTYVFNMTGPASLPDAFSAVDLEPDIALTARDADVIKTYVRVGLGVGIVAAMALDPEEDRDLVSIDASHLFPKHLTWVGFRRGNFLRRYMLDFMHQLAPHLDRTRVHKAQSAASQDEIDALFADVSLPHYH